MATRSHRRAFLRTATATSLVGLGDLSFLTTLRPLAADEVKLDPKLVKLDSGIEPLVQLLENTPREKLLEEIARRIKKGLVYRELLAALFLAGVRNIQPRPNVGFKFHAVLAVNSAHQATITSPDQHRWLPMFWAIDNFKASQARNQQEGGWRMGPVAEDKLPSPPKVISAFESAMENWDEAAADVAVAGLARHATAGQCFELFTHFGCRDFRDIGHKLIYVAGAFRVLQVIGWQHAEPVLRSLAYALLKHEGDNPAKRDGAPDRPFRSNVKLIKTIPDTWRDGKLDDQATLTLLNTIRTGSAADASKQVVDLLHRKVGPQSIWDGLLLSGGEMLMRQPGIVGLHTLTTANAFRYCFGATGNESTQRLLMTQLAAFMPLFRDAMKERGKVNDLMIDKMEPLVPEGVPYTLEHIFADVGRQPSDAARKTLGFVKNPADAKNVIDMARLMLFLKGNDSHDYKFSMSVLEDFDHVSTKWNSRFLAASTYWLKGSSAKDSELVQRTRAAFG